MTNNTVELELKFKADEIKASDFDSLLTGLTYLKKQAASSWDYYFIKEGTDDEFQRFRDSNTPELTKKVKTKDNNNLNRVESDLALDPARVTFDNVSFHVGLDGYKFNFKIFKTCMIYYFDNVNLVYYTVLDSEMKELSKFIEVEINKDKVKDLGDKALDVLKEWEKKLLPLGITPANRMKRSLFELYRK